MNHNYSPEEWEKQYTPSMWSNKHGPDEAMEYYMTKAHEESEKVTSNISDHVQLNYGDTDSQKIDVFGDNTLPKDSPILLFVHGGYWIFGCREESRFFIQPFYDAGIVCAALGYDLVSQKVTIEDMVLQVQKGICMLLKHAHAKGSRGVYLCGHSAGGHLVTNALSIEKIKDVSYDIIKGVIPVSGIYDLSAVLPTTNAAPARITKEIAEKCSPLNAVAKLKANLSLNTEILVPVAEFESPAFQLQSEVYCKALKNIGMNSEFMLVKDEDHFTVILKLCEPKFILTEKLLQLIAKHKK